MLFPRQPHHHPQTVALGCIKQPTRRYRIGADGIQAVARHLRKITLDRLEIVILIAIRIRTKRPIRDTPDPQLVSPTERNFPLTVGRYRLKSSVIAGETSEITVRKASLLSTPSMLCVLLSCASLHVTGYQGRLGAERHPERAQSTADNAHALSHTERVYIVKRLRVCTLYWPDYYSFHGRRAIIVIRNGVGIPSATQSQ